jgi:hypothetical protein
MHDVYMYDWLQMEHQSNAVMGPVIVSEVCYG